MVILLAAQLLLAHSSVLLETVGKRSISANSIRHFAFNKLELQASNCCIFLLLYFKSTGTLIKISEVALGWKQNISAMTRSSIQSAVLRTWCKDYGQWTERYRSVSFTTLDRPLVAGFPLGNSIPVFPIQHPNQLLVARKIGRNKHQGSYIYSYFLAATLFR